MDSAMVTDELQSLTGTDNQDQPESPQGLPQITSRMGVDMSRMLVFDFETGPDTERLHLFNLPSAFTLPVDECPSVDDFLQCNPTIKDIDKSLMDLSPHADWLRELKAQENSSEKVRKGVVAAIDKLLDGEVKLLKKLCVTPRFAKITAFGWAVGNEPAIGKVVSHIEQPAMDLDERQCLELFWELVEKSHPLIGFNVKAFDIPLALTRSAILGVTPTRRIKLNKYSNSEVIDLFSDQQITEGTCKDICTSFGINATAGDMSGAEAWPAYCCNPEGLREYVKSDVEIERQLFWFLSGYFWD